MKPLEKINLIKKIAMQLQETMSFSDIDTYLFAYGINYEDYDFSRNSKRVYVEEVLRYVSDDTILNIVEELEIEPKSKSFKNESVSFWKQGYLKLFISHLAIYKGKAKNLQGVLALYGISAFVAHEDIEASKEWQDEIEKALHTMDAMTVILTEGVVESEWCDQEIGFAVGKSSLIVPIQYGVVPYGFIGKYQAIQGLDKTVGDVALSIYNTILNSEKTSEKMQSILTSLIANSTKLDIALKRLKILEKSNNISPELLKSMSEKIRENTILHKSKEFMSILKRILNRYDIDLSILSKQDLNKMYEINEDDIPF